MNTLIVSFWRSVAHAKPPMLMFPVFVFFSGKRNEVAHAQYAAQLRQDRVDPLATAQTMLSAFLLDQMLSSESGLSIFLSIWARLRTDCNEIYHWVKNPGQSVSLLFSFVFHSMESNFFSSGGTLRDIVLCRKRQHFVRPFSDCARRLFSGCGSFHLCPGTP